MSQAWVGDESAVSRPFPLNDPTSVDATLIPNVLSASGGMDGWIDGHACTHRNTHAEITATLVSDWTAVESNV